MPLSIVVVKCSIPKGSATKGKDRYMTVYNEFNGFIKEQFKDNKNHMINLN
ncbi:hypothetical protein [Mycoplasma tauri]|uniref:hypothetical protein n=1 Tax=Mycoplasma tauri TaxID=547987 RepID=UPI001CBF43FA|nr:hypothetical protein [Mycoplasma tauri]MBZ4226735.1 hypothetical protein [Mycoplasma tauri]